jgi:putative hemolysin
MNKKQPGKAGPFSLHGVAALSDRVWMQKIIYRLFGLDTLDELYKDLPLTGSAQGFIKAILSRQKISYRIKHNQTQNFADGPLLVVANHPCGILEGLLLLDFLFDNRSDVKLLANQFLRRLPELSELLLGVIPFHDKAAITHNQQVLSSASRWLSDGHCMACFPAGNASRLQLSKFKIVDNKWSDQAVRLARLSGANILPVYFECRNSLFFYLLGLLGASMHSPLYVREFLSKQGVSQNMFIGEIIPINEFDGLGEQEATMRLRKKTYSLSKFPDSSTHLHI